MDEERYVSMMAPRKPAAFSAASLVLSQSPSKSDLWKGRRVVHLADSDALKPDPSTRVMTLDDTEIMLGIAKFRIDVRRKPRLQPSPMFRGRQEEKMKAKYDGRLE
ncbi:hypothetical protein LZ31DRAFT_630646 [Colletotrichum somersetense]|nr:hypothetical protein LZ31DRAFT_630646 [Colletotrichum somersetense]